MEARHITRISWGIDSKKSDKPSTTHFSFVKNNFCLDVDEKVNSLDPGYQYVLVCKYEFSVLIQDGVCVFVMKLFNLCSAAWPAVSLCLAAWPASPRLNFELGR